MRTRSRTRGRRPMTRTAVTRRSTRRSAPRRAQRARDSAALKILSLHHVSVTVRDLDEALHFYRDVLGLPVRTDRPAWMPPGAWLDIGDRRLNLSPGDPPANQQQGGPHFAVV